jgi:hypothetical protein
MEASIHVSFMFLSVQMRCRHKVHCKSLHFDNPLITEAKEETKNPIKAKIDKVFHLKKNK